MGHYRFRVGPFLDWLRDERPDVEWFEDLDVNVVRDYLLALTRRTSARTGRPLDALTRGRVELRVRWDAGAKGRKSRRVLITPRLALAIKRYQARHRRTTDGSELLISERGGRPFTRFGIGAMMDRLEAGVGFRESRRCRALRRSTASTWQPTRSASFNATLRSAVA